MLLAIYNLKDPSIAVRVRHEADMNLFLESKDDLFFVHIPKRQVFTQTELNNVLHDFESIENSRTSKDM